MAAIGVRLAPYGRLLAFLRLESRLAGGRGRSSHLPGRGGKSEAVYPMSLAALRGEGCVWSRRARGEGLAEKGKKHSSVKDSWP